jgi:hypothetical protein
MKTPVMSAGLSYLPGLAPAMVAVPPARLGEEAAPWAVNADMR